MNLITRLLWDMAANPFLIIYLTDHFLFQKVQILYKYRIEFGERLEDPGNDYR